MNPPQPPRQKKTGSPLERIGDRIRTARLRAGLTQGELAGESITRNMLSRIENGAALPSLTTLCAIADRLHIPAGALLCDLSDYDAASLTDALRLLMIKKAYAAVLDRFEASGVLVTDELAYILYVANVGSAWELYFDGRLTEALKRLKAAEIYPGLTDHDTTEIKRRAVTLHILIDCYEKPEEETVRKDGMLLEQLIFSENETAIYLYARFLLRGVSGRAYSVPDDSVAALENKLEPFITGLPDGLMKTHLRAKLDMAHADYLTAKAKLVPCLDTKDGIAPTMLYDVYTDLELCCKCCGDFENAYKYSGQKLELVKRIK